MKTIKPSEIESFYEQLRDSGNWDEVHAIRCSCTTEICRNISSILVKDGDDHFHLDFQEGVGRRQFNEMKKAFLDTRVSQLH